jgi:short-subunit dehydrogenase
MITGAASGIGRGIAFKCASSQMKLALIDSDYINLVKLADELLTITPDVLILHYDITLANVFETITKQIIQRYGKINLLINNAGVSGPFGPIWETPLAQIDWTINVNLISVINCLHQVVPLMIKQNDDCHIVNVSSHLGLVTTAHLSGYQITKHAITAMTEALQQDLIAAGLNKINVSIFFPYFVQSNLANSARHLEALNDTLYIANSAQQFFQDITELTNQGIDAITAADILFAGIAKNDLYIFTANETKDDFSLRSSKILRN